MTATDIATVTPAEGAAEGSTSKEASPVKTKTPEQVKDEAATLIAVGKRDLLLSNVPDAVSSLAQACEMLSKQFGETDKECAEGYFYYGKALLELTRMESGVLGNALEGVPEEESENNTSQFEDPAKLTDKEKNEVTDTVAEALEENAKDLEEKAEKAKEAKEGEKTNDTNKDKEGEKSESNKDKGEKAEASKEGEDKDGEGKETDEAMEEDEETGTEGEEEGEESSDEKKEDATEEGAEKKDEEEEPSNLQLAWEMLELAKVVYSKQLETGEGDKVHLQERLCSTMLALGEVSIENENYKQAVDDIKDCLKKLENLPKDARIVAETYYQLGVAQGFNAQHDEAVESLKSAINIIQERIKNMEKTETEEAKKEVTELKALVPEIEEKINDTQDMKKEAENKKEETSASGDAFGSSKVAEVKPVSSIAVKRKAEEEDTSSKKLASEKETAAAS